MEVAVVDTADNITCRLSPLSLPIRLVLVLREVMVNFSGFDLAASTMFAVWLSTNFI